MDLKTYISTSKRGTATRLARALGISRSYLSQMASGASSVSPPMSRAIETETDGAVPRTETRKSDWHLIWPELLESHDAVEAER